MADDSALDAIRHAVAAFTGPLSARSLPAVDLADHRTVFEAGGYALLGQGEASGEGRAIKAAEAALADLKRQLANEKPAPPLDPLAAVASR